MRGVLALFGDERGEGVEANEGSVAFLLLLEHTRVLEVTLELHSALDPSIAHLAHLRRVKFLPLVVVELTIEVSDEFAVDEVEEGVAHVAVVLSQQAVHCSRWGGRRSRTSSCGSLRIV